MSIAVRESRAVRTSSRGRRFERIFLVAVLSSALAVMRVSGLPALAAPAAPASASVAGARASAPPRVQTKLMQRGLKVPHAVAVDAAGDVFVADTGDFRVVEYPHAGGQKTLPFTGNLGEVTGVAVDSAGTVYAVFPGAATKDRVLALTSAGVQTSVPIDPNALLNGVASDAAGTIYLTDAPNHRVLRVPKGGAAAPVVGFSGDGPFNVAIDGAGDLFVAVSSPSAQSYVVELPKGGAQVTLPFAPFGNAAVALAVDGSGTVFATNPITGQVSRLKAGTQTTVAFTGLTGPFGVAVGTTGNLYVADGPSNRLVELPKTGPQVDLGTNGVVDPFSVATDFGGGVYVGDFGNSRVEKLIGGVQSTLPFAKIAVSSVAVDGAGDVFVGSQPILEIPKGGTEIVVPFTGPAPRGDVAADQSGNLYVLDYANNRVLERTSAGVQSLRPYTAVTAAGGHAVDGAGNVYVSDFSGHKVIKLAKAGGQTTLPFTGLGQPGALAVDPVGNVYVVDAGTNQVVELTTADVQSIVPFTGIGHAQAVAVDQAGNVFVTDVSRDGGLVKLSAAPGSPPGAPTIGTITRGNRSATVAWTAPASAGSTPISGYAVTPYVGGIAQKAREFTSTATSQRLTQLANGVVTRFTVAASNGSGSGGPSAASAPVLLPFASLDAFIVRQVHDFLGRAASSSEIAAERNDLVQGGSPANYVKLLRRSADGVTYVDPTTRLYFAYFLRTPDPTGLDHWVTQNRAGVSLDAISNVFAGSPEFKNRYGSLTNAQFVDLVYHNVLGRAGDPSGVAFWNKQLDTKAKTRGQVMTGVSVSTEFVNRISPSVDVAVTWIEMLGVRPDQASFDTWVTNLSTGGMTVTNLAAYLLADPRYASLIS